MNTLDKKYILDGISIDGNPEKGYTVFTILTQHFKIKSLDELTNKKFEEEINNQKNYEEKSSEMMRLYFETLNENNEHTR